LSVDGQVHIIGAGVAGLSCAVRLTRAGRQVTLYEAAGHTGGRCRSFHDATLDRLIDNGNHLLLSGNRAVASYLEDIGAADSLTGPDQAAFPFLDLKSGLRWTVAPNSGRIPWWIFSPGRRVPDSRAGDYLQGFRLAASRGDGTVASVLDPARPLYRRFWEPLAVAVLNTAADEGAASLLWPVIRETFGRGEAACRPRIARVGLSDSFVDPALRLLERAGCPVLLNHRLRGIEVSTGRAMALDITGGRVDLGGDDQVVLAVPPAAAAGLVPGLTVPRESRAIVNGHFRLARAHEGLSFLGIVGGVCQWLFVRGDIASVTVSAADDLAEDAAPSIAARMWREIARALDLGDIPVPPHRIVKEKRATFAQTPEEARRRPGPGTAWSNLILAGDWTDTGLPATIEGALRSGYKAADMSLTRTSNA
jgi:squalene-associated FAD-dependent desaturase